MLQINTGRFFKNGINDVIPGKAVLYSNARISNQEINTSVGKLSETRNHGFPHTLAYEFEERFERARNERIIISRSNELIREFSILATFGLGVLFSQERDQLKKLVDKNSSLYNNQKELVKNYYCDYEDHLFIKRESIEEFRKFVDEFIGLERKNYLTVKHAIKKFVVAIDRIPDDHALAYTMMVSAIDTIASTPSKAKQNYINFITEYVNEDEITDEEDLFVLPTRKPELSILAKHAYELRSDYIHKSAPLPQILTEPANYREVAKISNKYYLTLHGLARLTRIAMKNYVYSQIKVSEEDYDYVSDTGVRSAPLSIRSWTGYKLMNDDLLRIQARDMIDQITQICFGVSHELSSMKKVLNEIEEKFQQSEDADKMTMLVIYYLYNFFTPSGKNNCVSQNFESKCEKYLNTPCAESMLIRTITNNHTWSLKDHMDAYRDYRKRKNNKEDDPRYFIVSHLFEAAFALSIAARYRKNDKYQTEKFLKKALDCFPHSKQLRDFIIQYDTSKPIIWNEILLSNLEENINKINLINSLDVNDTLKSYQELTKILSSYICPIFWEQNEANDDFSLKNGTMFFWNTGEKIIAVTSYRVFEEYKMDSTKNCQKSQLLNIDFDLIEQDRLIDINSDLDIATFNISQNEIDQLEKLLEYKIEAYKNKIEIPQTGDELIFVGFPTNQIEYTGGVNFGISGCSVTVVGVDSNSNIIVNTDLENPLVFSGKEDQFRTLDFNGIEGTPLFKLVKDSNVGFWKLCGIIPKHGIEGKKITSAIGINLINSDGTIKKF